MNFKEKYINEAEKTKPEHKEKIVLSDDSFAIAELIEEIRINIKRQL